MRAAGVTPGDYVLPYAGSMEALKDPAFVEKLNAGPVGFLTVSPNGPFRMAPRLAQWFTYCLVVSLCAAYMTGRALGPGAHDLTVFRFAGTTAFIGYGLALWQNTIWYRKSWVTTLKQNVDALLYGCLTAGTFGWLWPR
jgi:hypothetical protein